MSHNLLRKYRFTFCRTQDVQLFCSANGTHEPQLPTRSGDGRTLREHEVIDTGALFSFTGLVALPFSLYPSPCLMSPAPAPPLARVRVRSLVVVTVVVVVVICCCCCYLLLLVVVVVVFPIRGRVCLADS